MVGWFTETLFLQRADEYEHLIPLKDQDDATHIAFPIEVNASLFMLE